MNKLVTKENWIALFTEAGLSEAQMLKWHAVFEARHPAGHQSFLEWLGVDSATISKIRSESK